jgi:hypothetical protein
MMHILVRHKVADFAKWKPVYDAHLSSRQRAGLKQEHLVRNADDLNEVLLLFSAEDVDKAKAFTASDDLRRAMEKAGVSDKRTFIFSHTGLQGRYAKFYSRSRGLPFLA